LYVVDDVDSDTETKWEDENDLDNNFVEIPDHISEPRRRKMSLRASIIGQPGILAGLFMSVVHRRNS